MRGIKAIAVLFAVYIASAIATCVIMDSCEAATVRGHATVTIVEATKVEVGVEWISIEDGQESTTCARGETCEEDGRVVTSDEDTVTIIYY